MIKERNYRNLSIMSGSMTTVLSITCVIVATTPHMEFIIALITGIVGSLGLFMGLHSVATGTYSKYNGAQKLFDNASCFFDGRQNRSHAPEDKENLRLLAENTDDMLRM